MLILVAVTISMAVNGGLFNYAGKMVGDTQNAIDKEQQLASGQVTIGNTTYNSIDEYLKPNENATEETLISLWNAGKLNVGDYVDYNPKGATLVNPDNPENVEGDLKGTLTGYTTAAQSVAYENLKWRVLGVDGDNILLISATPTTGGLTFFGHVGYNNYENVLETVCSKLYSNTSIGAIARSITMNDIDTYLGGSTVDKTKYVGGSTTEDGLGYKADITSKFKINTSGKLERVANDGTETLEDLESTAYYYMVSDITGTMNQELLQGTNADGPYYYWVSSNTLWVVSAYTRYARWCVSYVDEGYVGADQFLCNSLRGPKL